MTYPSTPDFTSGDWDSAWWIYHRTDVGEDDLCSTTGSGMILAARRALGVLPTAVWDDTFQRALIRKAGTISGAESVVTLLQADFSARSISVASLQFAIFIAWYYRTGLRLDAIEVQPDAVVPQWGVAVPAGPAGLYCAVVGVDVFPPAPSDRAIVARQSASGVRVHPGEASPAQVPPDAGHVSFVWVGLAALAMVGVVWTVTKKGKK